MNKLIKLITGLGAVLEYGVASYLLMIGMPALPLWIAVVASAEAIGLIIVEWARN